MKTNYILKTVMVLIFSIVGTVFIYAQKYEAESATFGGGLEYFTEGSGYSGTGYLRNFNTVGQYVEFTLTGATAGEQTVTLRYLTDIAGSLNLYVNGTFIRTETIPGSGGWTTWADYDMSVTLVDGNNTIKFIHETENEGNFFYFIDYLQVGADIAVTGVTVSPTTLSMPHNGTSKLTATVSPVGASITAVTWKSSDDNIATVNSQGTVTAVAPGNVTITATTQDGDFMADCTISVFASVTEIYETEDAAFGNVNINTGGTGFSGTGYLGNFGTTNAYVEFSITGAAAGNQSVRLRYTTGNENGDGSLHLYVNDAMIRKEAIVTTGGWTNWQDYTINVTLNAGSNTIKLIHESDDTGLYYIDYLKVDVLDSSTEISEISKDNGLLLFPNPLSSGSLSVKLPEDATQLSIFDVTGKMIYQEKVMKTEYLIDQSIFNTNGVYVVNVLTANSPINKKVIVAK